MGVGAGTGPLFGIFTGTGLGTFPGTGMGTFPGTGLGTSPGAGLGTFAGTRSRPGERSRFRLRTGLGSGIRSMRSDRTCILVCF